MPFTEISTGARIHYDELNADVKTTPVIVVHGLLGTARYDLGDVMDWLAKRGHRIIGPSMRGYGQSTPKPRDFPYRFYHRDAADLVAFMDALSISRAHLLGYSDGGEIVLIVAGEHPQRVQSVAAIGAVGNFGPELRPVFQRAYPGTWIKPEELQMHQIPDADEFVRGWVRASVQMLDAGGDVSLATAKHITSPLLLMLGKSDRLNPEEYGRLYVQRAPRGELVMFDCGHAVHKETPEAFRSVYGTFLDKASHDAL